MAWPGIIGLGEMMNFPGVDQRRSQQMLAEIAATQSCREDCGRALCQRRIKGASVFMPMSAGGPADDHEGTSEADAIARVRQGMRAMLRLGSAWYDVESADHR